MIAQVLNAITYDLNAFLMRKNAVQETIVELSALVNLDGTIAIKGNNKVLCSLINIQQDRTSYNTPTARNVKKNPPVQLNLFVLFSAYYQTGNYPEGLKAISSVIGFFQGRQVFTPANTSRLPASIDKVTFELVNFDINEVGNFWAAVGTKHLPSVLYKCRLISITEDIILEDIPTIEGFATNPKTDN